MDAFKVDVAIVGAGLFFRENTGGGIATRDAMALACRHAVPLPDAEFVQYHLPSMPGAGLLFTQACRGERGFLLNRVTWPYALAFPPHWAGMAFLFAVVALFLWHAAHRIFHRLHHLRMLSLGGWCCSHL